MAYRPIVFRPVHSPSPAEARRQSDRDRGSSRDRGYTARWDKASRTYRRDNPLCRGCQAVGLCRATDVVDHIIPHKGDDRLFWDQDNWQPACSWHHDVVKQKLETMWSRDALAPDALDLASAIAQGMTRSLMPA